MIKTVVYSDMMTLCFVYDRLRPDEVRQRFTCFHLGRDCATPKLYWLS